MAQYPNAKYVECSAYQSWTTTIADLGKVGLRGFQFDFFLFRLCLNGQFSVRPGFCFDVSGIPSTPSTLAPALIHDALYTCLKLELIPRTERLRHLADSYFYHHLIAHGASETKAGIYYEAVQRLGKRFMERPMEVKWASPTRWWGEKDTRPRIKEEVSHWSQAMHLVREVPSGPGWHDEVG